MNDHETNVIVNAPRAMLCVAVKSQVSLLMKLYDADHLDWLGPGGLVSRGDLIKAIMDIPAFKPSAP